MKTVTKYTVNGIFNFAFGFFAYRLISLFKIKNLAGFTKKKIQNWEILLFPIYIIIVEELINPSFHLFQNISLEGWIVLFFWIISVSFVEELVFRGLLQSVIIKKFARNKITLISSVFIASVIFGAFHLIDFDLGFYNELSQLFYAMFLGVLFGVFILITRKIWPVILIHTLINIPSVLGIFQSDIVVLSQDISFDNSQPKDLYYWTLLHLPCFIYGIYLLVKLEPQEVEEIIDRKN